MNRRSFTMSLGAGVIASSCFSKSKEDDLGHFYNKIKENPDKLWFSFRAMMADTPNINGDIFPADEIKSIVDQFVKPIYSDVYNGNIIGEVVVAHLVDNGECPPQIICYAGITKKATYSVMSKITKIKETRNFHEDINRKIIGMDFCAMVKDTYCASCREKRVFLQVPDGTLPTKCKCSTDESICRGIKIISLCPSKNKTSAPILQIFR